jgi:hypothetical protein
LYLKLTEGLAKKHTIHLIFVHFGGKVEREKEREKENGKAEKKSKKGKCALFSIPSVNFKHNDIEQFA